MSRMSGLRSVLYSIILQLVISRKKRLQIFQAKKLLLLHPEITFTKQWVLDTALKCLYPRLNPYISLPGSLNLAPSHLFLLLTPLS